MDARLAAERAARRSYGKLLAALGSRTRDLGAAEDVLAEAFLAALRQWPREGVPDRPEAWLLTVSKRRLADQGRRQAVREASVAALEHMASLHGAEASDDPLPDRRLTLLFVCAHPAIDEAMHTPLMLQVVLGLDAARIASAFLVRPAAMAQRLSRTKARIRDAGVPFEVPVHRDLGPRLDRVLEAIYAAFTAGADDPQSQGLAAEALELARLVAEALPDEPEAQGLLALLLHAMARQSAGRSDDGRYVALSDQDTARWDWTLQVEAEQRLFVALRQGRFGRFQIEAAIQSAHAARAYTGRTDWPAILGLYEGLLTLVPTLGARLGHAAALAENGRVTEALARLDELPAERVADWQPYFALRAELLRRTGDLEGARSAARRARELAADPAVQAFLAERHGL